MPSDYEQIRAELFGGLTPNRDLREELFGPLYSDPSALAHAERKSEELHGWRRLVDLLSRGTYASAGFVDTLMTDGMRAIGKAWYEARTEFTDPDDRRTFADLIRKHSPKTANDSPFLTEAAGLVLDIALDPLTYVPLSWAGKATRLSSAGIRKAGVALGLVDDTANLSKVSVGINLAGEGSEVGMAALRRARESRELAEITKSRAADNLTKQYFDVMNEAYLKRTARIDQGFDKQVEAVDRWYQRELLRLAKEAKEVEQRVISATVRDTIKYGDDAERVISTRRAFPTAPDRVIGGPPAPVPSKRVGRLKLAHENRRGFRVVPEKSINPEAVPKTVTEVTSSPGQITRQTGKIVEETGSQRVLSALESTPATRVEAIRRQIPGQPPVSDDLVRMVDSQMEFHTSEFARMREELAGRYQSRLRAIDEARVQAKGQPLDIGLLARTKAVKTVQEMKVYEGVPLQPSFQRASAVLGKAVAEGGKPGAAAEVFEHMSGIRRLKDLWAESGVAKWLADKGVGANHLFRAHFQEPEWLTEATFRLYSDINRGVKDLETGLLEVFGDLSKESGVKLRDLAYHIFYTTRDMEKAAGGRLSLRQAAEIRHTLMKQAGLTDQEFEAMGRFYTQMEAIGEVESNLKLIDGILPNYVPGIYQNLENTDDVVGLLQKLRTTPSIDGIYTHGEKKVFETIKQMKAAGLEPLEDIFKIYGARLIAHKQAFAQHQFSEQVARMFPGLKYVKDTGSGWTGPISPLLGHLGTVNKAALLKEFPDAVQITKGARKGAWVTKNGDEIIPSIYVQKKISFVGDGLYGPEAYKDAGKLLRYYDKGMKWFRTAATVLKVSFGPKQMVSNPAQLFLEGGAEALRAFDPRVMADAAMILSNQAPKFAIVDQFGRKITGSELLDEVLSMGMLTSTVVDPGMAKNISPRMVRELGREVDRMMAVNRLAGENATKRGWTKIFMGAANYMNIPGHVEDFSRVSGYINYRRLGYTPTQAAEKVNKALFNYKHGLSEFETKFMRRLIPFYSYQRFATPLLFNALIHDTGRVANLAKVTDAVFNSIGTAMGGDTLTDTERQVLPDFLIEQPSAFERFNGEMEAIFGTWNNFTPLDVFATYTDLVAGDPDQRTLRGGLDPDKGLKRGFEKAVLSQITPFIKVPIEILAERNFFTGKVLKNAQTVGGSQVKEVSGNYDPDLLFANLMGAATALAGGGTLGAAGVTAGLTAGADTPPVQLGVEAMKNLLGWEEGIDPRTGKRKVYMTPWMVYMVTNALPGLREAFVVSDEDQTPTERTISFLTGKRTVKVDLGQAQQSSISNLDRLQSKWIRENIDKPLEQERLETYHEGLANLEDFLDEIAEQYLRVTGPVRRAQYNEDK